MGNMGYHKIGNQLPLDYVPLKKEATYIPSNSLQRYKR